LQVVNGGFESVCILRSENHSIPTLPKLPAAERNEGAEMLSWVGWLLAVEVS